MKKKVTITVCDVCEDEERVTTRVRVTGDLGPRTLDLCDEHVKPIARLLNPTARPSARIRRRKPRSKVTNLDAKAG